MAVEGTGQYDPSWPRPKWLFRARTVNLLPRLGADVTVRDKRHSTPLHRASARGEPESMERLIQHGAGVTVRDRGTEVTRRLCIWRRAGPGSIGKDRLHHICKILSVEFFHFQS